MKKVNNTKPRASVMGGKASFSKNAQVVITADTKVTICPGHKPRFEAVALPGNLSVQKGRVASQPEALGQPAHASELEASHD